MKIIKSYWSENGAEKEKVLKNSLATVTRFFVGRKEIKNFSINETAEGRIQINYALKKGARLKYYCSLLNRSFAVGASVLIALDDSCFLDYDTATLRDSILELINKKK